MKKKTHRDKINLTKKNTFGLVVSKKEREKNNKKERKTRENYFCLIKFKQIHSFEV